MIKDKISILMGIYNCEETLSEAIESILAQTYENWELILCDDCSTDGTYALAKAYQKKYPEKIILLQNDQNRHLAYSLNHCLSVAKGEFFARMDGDDRSVPERFEKQVAFLREHPEVHIVGTAMQRFSDEGLGAIDGRPEWPARECMHRSTLFNHATIMGYTWVLNALEGYTVKPRTIRGQDVDLWYRFIDADFKGANLSEVLYLVREDENAIKKRSFKDRWMGLQTNFYGYRLLHYPKVWYFYLLFNFLKFLIPLKVMLSYRRYQTLKQKQNH